ncbi:MAG: tail fiber domain-containing protein [Flavisolibacter sp.]
MAAFAQSWNITGNSNATPTSILGNTNAVPLRLFTKNVARIVIDTFGFVGINSAHPVSTLDVRGTQFLSGQLKFGTGAHNIQFANPTATANKPMMLMFTAGPINPPRMVISHSTTLSNVGLQFDDATKNFNFLGSGFNVLTVGVGSLNVGIHTNAPGFPLNFDDLLGDKISLWGNAGNHYGFGIQSQTLQIHTDISSSDVAFGYGSSAAFTETARIRGNGDIDASNSVSGFTGPKPFASGIFANNNNTRYNIIATNIQTGFWWGIFHSPTGELSLGLNGGFRGSFDPTTGAYTSISDARLKTNIKPMESVLDKINQLKPSSYQFKDAKNKQLYDGFIAQDVEKIFPNLVYHIEDMGKKEVYTMNYSGFGVIAIKAIQELQEEIKTQKQETQDQMLALTDKIKHLESIIEKLAPGQFQSVTTASMEQNSPNPARTATSIGYSIPTNNGSAQLQLIDNLGRTVKTIQLNSSGRINLDLSSLSSGTYTYSLVVDGKVVETKKLVKATDN